jgi:hypothetical protein
MNGNIYVLEKLDMQGKANVHYVFIRERCVCR